MKRRVMVYEWLHVQYITRSTTRERPIEKDDRKEELGGYIIWPISESKTNEINLNSRKHYQWVSELAGDNNLSFSRFQLYDEEYIELAKLRRDEEVSISSIPSSTLAIVSSPFFRVIRLALRDITFLLPHMKSCSHFCMVVLSRWMKWFIFISLAFIYSFAWNLGSERGFLL